MGRSGLILSIARLGQLSRFQLLPTQRLCPIVIAEVDKNLPDKALSEIAVTVWDFHPLAYFECNLWRAHHGPGRARHPFRRSHCADIPDRQSK